MVLYEAAVAVALLGSCWGAPPVDSDPAAYKQENYDVDSDSWDLNSYGETLEYDDYHFEEVMRECIEIRLM